jgi:hypothetical protein
VPSQPQRSALKGGSSNQSRQPSYRQQQPAQPEYDDYAQPSIPSSVASNRNPYQVLIYVFYLVNQQVVFSI